MKAVLRAVVLVALGVAVGSPAAAQPQITSTPLSDGIYLIHSTAGPIFNMNNLLLVDAEGVVLLDTLPPQVPLYFPFNAVIQSRTEGRPVTTIVNTSWHYDHVGLNDQFVTRAGTDTIVAHWRAGAYMTDMQCIDDIGLCMPAFPAESQPTVNVHGEMRIPFGGETLRLKTVENAHSNADLFVYLPHANILYTGDVYFGGIYPIIDRTAGGTVNGTLAALREMLARIDEDTIVVPSHGAVGNRQSVVDFVQMLETSRKQVRALIAEGLTEEEVMNHPSFAALDARWAAGAFLTAQQFRMILYRDLAPNRE